MVEAPEPAPIMLSGLFTVRSVPRGQTPASTLMMSFGAAELIAAGRSEKQLAVVPQFDATCPESI